MKNININLIYIKLNNFKNIKNGEISFNKNNKHFFNDNGKLCNDCEAPRSKIIGLYGPNGSGKTAVITAIDLLKKVMSGNSIKNNQEYYHYIYCNEERATLSFIFLLEFDSNKYLVSYKFTLSKKYNSKLLYNYADIDSEELSYKLLKKNDRENVLIEYDNSISEEPNNNIFSGKLYNNFSYLNEKQKIEIMVIKGLSEKQNTSFCFHNDFLTFLESSDIILKNDKFKILKNILNFLSEFAISHLFVMTKNDLGLISLDALLPFNFHAFTNEHELFAGNIGLSLNGKNVWPETVLEAFKVIINQINITLKHIIPNLLLEIKDLNNDEFNEKMEKTKKFEILAVKNDISIPLKYESDGTKKIIALLNVITALYNNPNIFLAVDELDSGIFEYLLGELLSILENRIEGRLLFTSHNLVILEQLNVESLRFSTTDENNRFVSYMGLKDNNNLRSVYLRQLKLGNDDDKIDFYSKPDKYEIAYALKKAGEIKYE